MRKKHDHSTLCKGFCR